MIENQLFMFHVRRDRIYSVVDPGGFKKTSMLRRSSDFILNLEKTKKTENIRSE